MIWKDGHIIRILIIDDEFISRKRIYKLLAKYGECDLAASDMESLIAFDIAMQENSPYNLVTLDSKVSATDGKSVLSMIREKERKLGIPKKTRRKLS